jgi:hypothetical protein
MSLAVTQNLDVNRHSASVTVVHFAFFDVGDQAGSLANERLKELATAQTSSILYAYDVSRGVIHTRSTDSNTDNYQFPNILEKYRVDMYGRRIAAFARTQRFGQMYQLEPISLMGLSRGTTDILAPTEKIIAHPIVSVTNLGVASIQLWLQLPKRWHISDVIPFNDPAQLFVSSVDYELTLKNARWNLHRHNISVLDVMCFVAAQLLCELDAINVPENNRRSETANWQDVLRTASHQSSDKKLDLPHLEYIETYPLYHLNFQGNTQNINCEELSSVLKNNPREFRALITRDNNWNVKKKDMVEESLKKSSCSTRDSIQWFVGPQGSVKAYCDDLETDIHTSMVLAAFEIELLLCMKYFLEKINYSLNQVTFEKTSPQLLARIHRQNIEQLDSFFSLATCIKDTTAGRLERLKQAFGITHLSNTTAEKVNALSELVSAYHDERIQNNQTVLTVLFGVFGAGSITASFFIWYYSLSTPPEKALVIKGVGLTLVSMVIIGFVIYFIGQFGRRRRR